VDGHGRALGVLICLLALLQIRPVVVRSWKLNGETLAAWKGARPPHLSQQPLDADLNGDGCLERVILRGEQVKIVRTGQAGGQSGGCGTDQVWVSPPAWQIRRAMITDLNRDRTAEVTFLVWRPFKPWPIDRYIPNGGRINEFHTQDGLSSHIVLLGWNKGKFRELWAGSAMVRPFLAFSVGDLNRDGNAELVGIEGNYATRRPVVGNILSVWEWNGFGFTRLARIDGTFRDVGVAHAGEDGYLILTQN
jgi:hypothetical protein